MNLVLPAGVPTWLWIVAAVLGVALSALAFWLLRKATRYRKDLRGRPATPLPAGGSVEEQTKAQQDLEKARRANRLVNIAATVCILLYLGLFASSFAAIAGFAREFLKREGILIPATPLTLDGVVVGALLLSLAFVAKRKSPAKAHLLIWGMTLFAAYCGFTYGEHGGGGSVAAGLYYAVMSIVGMFMFHMVLELFQDDGDFVRSKYPGMGLRWFTHWSTLPVMLCWINHPPRRSDDAMRPTVRDAIDHWRRTKSLRLRAKAIAAAEEHTRKIAAERRKGELATARRVAERAAAPLPPAEQQQPAPAFAPTVIAQPARQNHSQVLAYETATPRPATITAPVSAPPAAEQSAAVVKVPATAEACETWMEQWVALSAAHPNFVAGKSGIKPEDAQATAKCSDRQARNVREAARTGQLRAKAAELGVRVPDGYRDRPEIAEPKATERPVDRVPAGVSS